MSSISKVLAKAILKLDQSQLRELLADVAKEFDIDITLPPPVPEGYVLVPREMTGAMIWAAMDHQWTTHTADRNIRAMWKNILEVAS